MSHLNKAKLLRQKLREKKIQTDKEEGKDQESNPPESKEDPKDEKLPEVKEVDLNAELAKEPVDQPAK